MVSHMKTTIEIADQLLDEAKRRASAENRTLRDLVEEALRRLLAERSDRQFRLEDGSFRGNGLQPGIQEGDWERVRDLIYRG